jgi:magnesium chelatase family protein
MKQTKSATLHGYESRLVTVETTFTKGLPSFSIVGLASSSIQESKERVKSALLSNDFVFPPLRITLNLSPSDLHKDGTQFDLSIALLIALYSDKSVKLDDWTIFGELGLDGKVKENSTLFAQVLSYTSQHPKSKIMVPFESAEKLSLIDDVEIFPVKTLKESIAFFRKEIIIEPIKSLMPNYKTISIHNRSFHYQETFELDFKEVKGQEIAKRAALIAASGGHNLLLEGNPGSGKSMIAKRLASILPPLSKQELLEIAKLDSLNGHIPTFQAQRPSRSPHHSCTSAAIFGGGSKGAQIGEAGLAHLGMLFFDELPHFSKNILEALREPLEDRKILISRVQSKTEYKTDFLFLAAMNPCPCGNLLSTSKECRCSDSEIKRYKNRLSDPFLERIDLNVSMQENQMGDQSSLTSKQMQSEVFKAFSFRHKRNQISPNGQLSDKDLETYCSLNSECESILRKAVERFALSARAINKVKKVARTIADLNEIEQIQKQHLLESLSFRRR